MNGVLRVVLLTLALALAASAAAQSGDAFGDGSLLPPTSPRFADPAWYDIVDVTLFDTDPISLQLTLGAIDGSGGGALGLTQPIVEVYLADDVGGAERLLPGSSLTMPLGIGWRWAVRLSSDGAWGWEADELGRYDLAAPVALDARVSGREVTVMTPFALPEGRLDVYAISGVYDPFAADGWRTLARAPSPWAFSSQTQQVPVVDVFPGDAAARADALARGELPRATRADGAFGPGAEPWLALMGAGVLLAFAGLALRARAARLSANARRAPSVADTAAADTAGAAPTDRVADAPSDGEPPLLIEESEVVDWPRSDAATTRALPAPSAGEAGRGEPAQAGQSAAERTAATADPDSDAAAASTNETAAPSEAKRDDKPS